MIPNIKFNERVMIEKLSEAIKSVYASAYFKDSKSYMAATLNMIDEEKMGIVLQEVTGTAIWEPFLSGDFRCCTVHQFLSHCT